MTPSHSAPAGDFAVLPDGRRLRYAVLGEGPPLVLIHGAMVTLEDMLAGPADPLARGNRVFAFDRPGHGLSDANRLEGSVWRQAELIFQAMQALGLERPILVGHSYGGAVALALAIERPEAIAGLVAIAPIAYPELRLEQVLFGARAAPGLGDALNATAGIAFDAAVVPSLLEAMFAPQTMPDRFRALFPFDLAMSRKQMQAVADDAAAMPASVGRLSLSYGACRTPVRILAGREDKVVDPKRNALRLAGDLPNAQIELLAGLGHMLHHFAPERVVAGVNALRREAAPLAGAPANA